MSDETYRVTEVVGSSTESIQQPVRNGIARANKTLRNLNWFEVTEIRGHIVDSAVGHFQAAWSPALQEPERLVPVALLEADAEAQPSLTVTLAPKVPESVSEQVPWLSVPKAQPLEP